MLPVPTFVPLLDTADAITQILTQSEESMDIVEATTTESQRTKDITRYDAAIKSVLVPTLERYKPMEQASLLEAAFKLKLLTAQVCYLTLQETAQEEPPPQRRLTNLHFTPCSD